MIQDVTAAIIYRCDQVLIARRAEGRHAGEWEFPGGKVEPGESPEECLAREIHEEFGVTCCVGEFVAESVYDYGHGHIRLLAYEVVLHCNDLEPVDHDQIEWVTPTDLLTYSLLPADIPIAEKLGG